MAAQLASSGVHLVGAQRVREQLSEKKKRETWYEEPFRAAPLPYLFMRYFSCCTPTN